MFASAICDLRLCQPNSLQACFEASRILNLKILRQLTSRLMVQLERLNVVPNITDPSVEERRRDLSARAEQLASMRTPVVTPGQTDRLDSLNPEARPWAQVARSAGRQTQATQATQARAEPGPSEPAATGTDGMSSRFEGPGSALA